MPKVADNVATAERRTLSGVYIEQMNETRYDYATVKTPNKAIFTGKVLESLGDKTK